MADDDFDSLEDDIMAAMETAKEPATEAPKERVEPEKEPVKAKVSVPKEVAKEPAKEPDESDTRERDESGRFKAKVAEKESEPEEPTEAPIEEAPVEVKQEDRVPPPANWNGKGKVAWEKLPKAVKLQLLDDHKRFSETESSFEPLKSVLAPRAQALAATYGSVPAGLNNLFMLSDYAAKNPEGFIQWFASQRGINLGGIGQGQPQQQPAQPGQAQQAPPEVYQKVSQLENTILQWQQQQQAQERSSLQSQIDAFASDPAHPYFNDVRQQMGVLIEGGQAKTLDEAYDAAVWARKDLREDLLEQQREAERQRLAKTTEQTKSVTAAKVAQAKRAGGSITGAPKGAKPPEDTPNDETLEGLIARLYREKTA